MGCLTMFQKRYLGRVELGRLVWFGTVASLTAMCLVASATPVAAGATARPTAASAASPTPSAWSPATLTSPHPQAFAQFGSSMSASGGLVVVGSPDENVSGRQAAGAAYVFSLKTGMLVRSFTSPNVQPNGHFGCSVAISGSVVVIGAYFETVAGMVGGGRAYVYSLGGTLLTTLVSPNLATGGDFGSAVGVSGSRVIVGAPGENAFGQSAAGHAYLFRTTGALITQLTSPEAEFYGGDNASLFGQAVAIGGPFAVVGAEQESAPAGANAGHAYVFRSSDGQLEQVLTSPNAANGGGFGAAVAVRGPTVVVGAPFEDVGSYFEEGHAYAFQASTGRLTAVFSAPGNANQSFFGMAVGIAKGIVVVGAPDAPVSSQIEAGQAYTYSPNGTLVLALASPNHQPVGTFGSSVAVAGGYVAVGASDESVSGQSGAGHAYT